MRQKVGSRLQIDLSIGSQVKVLGIRGSQVENWYAVILNNKIKVQSTNSSIPFSKYVTIGADQVVDKSNGWKVGSKLSLKDGRAVTVIKTPKISLMWLKEMEGNLGFFDTKPYHPKVEVEAISKNINVAVVKQQI